MKLIRSKNFGYGNYKCSCCKDTLLEGWYNYVGDVKDEEGYHWRGFCNKCWKTVSKKTNKEIYSQYEEAPDAEL